jgi:hypothetical protein
MRGAASEMILENLKDVAQTCRVINIYIRNKLIRFPEEAEL